MIPLRISLSLLLVRSASAYWDGSKDSPDPYTAAMMMSRQAQHDPSTLSKDPDHFKKLFGKLAIEQNQAKSLDEHQTTTAMDRCMACHGVVVEFEKMMVERKTAGTGGHGRRDQLAVADTFEKICHMDRYEFMDPVNINKRSQASRKYGGIAPPLFANACKRVIDEWSDHDEAEELLIAGGSAANLFEELRTNMCDRAEFGLCRKLGKEVEVRKNDGEDTLAFKGETEQCAAEGGTKKKKKKKKAKKSPIEDV
jgi:hypothetical protein